MSKPKKITLIRLGSARQMTRGSQGKYDEPVIGGRHDLPGG